MPQLVAPTVSLRGSWLEAQAEWEPGAHMDGAGLRSGDDVRTESGFATWVDRLQAAGPAAPDRETPTTYWWVADGDTYLGAVELRHHLDAFLLDAGGHVGYSVRPSARRRGVATWALGAALDEAESRGMRRVLVTCAARNTGSARAIERNGGVLEDVRRTATGRVRRYWVERGPL
ncbi:GNAT family N-acetyltransferase [Antribacter gilvus]|uniref:GNAT family N-acetyltransferase n=1 Tax=Antribacter gilvus TaxID=2304675 RepID=UPI000F795475|nr:GNAT family N-acetyltransferase [Antribacter gilvus]